MVRLQFPNSDVADILHLYEQLTGKKLIMDNFVQGKVNIFISKDVPREEAIKIIEINLLMNGFSLVPAENDIVKVIGTGRNPRTTGVPVISDESEIPSGDHVISFLFKLRYADATELQQVLNQYLQPVQPYTSILALPKASSVLITENSSVIRSLAHIVNQIDVPPAEVVSEFIKLERADASKVVEMLNDIFEKGQSSTSKSGPGGVRAVRAPVPQQVMNEGDTSALTALTALSEEAVVVGKIKITPDVRTNRIHVVTRPINMPFIRKLIGEFDANVEFAKPVTRPLKYISAGEILPVLVQALTEPGSDQKGGEGASQNLAPQQQQQRRNPTTGATGQGGGTSEQHGRHGKRQQRRQQPQRFGRTFHHCRRYHAQSGHDWKCQDHRRPARELDHHARQPRSGHEGPKDSRRDGRESAAGRAQHRDRRVDAEQRRNIRRRLFFNAWQKSKGRRAQQTLLAFLQPRRQYHRSCDHRGASNNYRWKCFQSW